MIDYSNLFHPTTSSKKDVFADLKHQASKLEGIAMSVVLMLVELSVEDDLVFNSTTNELVHMVHMFTLEMS